MITVSIGGMAIPIEKVSQGWVNQMIAEAKKRNVPLCVQVNIQTPEAQVSLASGGCPPGGGGFRSPNRVEARIIEAWRRRRLSDAEINPGELRAFLNDIARLM